MSPPLPSAVASGNRRLVVSVSGGKDSTATALHLRELGLPFEAVHMDTGWEHTETVRYVRDVLPGVIGVPITVLQGRFDLPPHLVEVAERFERDMGVPYSSMVRAILHKGMFSSKKRRFCTQELKVFPFRDWCRKQFEQYKIVNVQGIRHEESTKRAAMAEFDAFDGDCAIWRPLIGWTLDDVIAIHHRHNVAPNPLYLRGASRVGCWPCLFARKAEVRMLATVDPERVELMARLETAVFDVAAARYAVRGETFESLGYVRPRPAWFQDPRPPQEERDCECVDGDGEPDGECPICDGIGTKTVRAGRPMPIREVVAWSMTKRGRGDFEPFAPDPSDGGCFRWGLCDMPWRGEISDHEVPADLVAK